MTDESTITNHRTAALERRVGIKLATALSAPKTVAAIKDLDSCYGDIFSVAAAELGADQIVSHILKLGHASWAQHALSHIPNLSLNQRQALAQQASVVVGNASTIELYLAPGAAFEAWFTMFWQNTPGGDVFPIAATPDENQWKWSKRLSIAINRSDTLRIADFAIANAPIEVGATCWMVVQIVAGSRHELSSHSLTYQQGGPDRLFNTWGVVNKPHFCMQDYPNPGDCSSFDS